jgi:hydroxyacylglutathione hydrolase
MLIERIESKGLAHYSYLIGDGNEAAVIDPRRDCTVYVEKAFQEDCRISHILETHRNEDYVIGSVELSARTDAEIWHADAQLDYQYGQPAQDGQTWKVGRLKLRAIHTPGHTPGSMSYLLYDPNGAPWMVLTGDALFAGDVGRVDLLGSDRMEEMAGLLYDSLFSKLLKLDDGVIVCPAHGSGSVCGTAIAERIWTTIGLERQHNPRLQYTDRSEFVAEVARELERPPYFRQMEKLNIEGAPVLGSLPVPKPLSPNEFARQARDAIVVDTRMEVAFGASHVQDAISIWLDGLPSFAGWFLPYDRPILLVNGMDSSEQAVRGLIRLGYDELSGYLSGEMHAWHTAGLESKSVKMLTVQGLCHLLDEHEDIWILDVRSEEELANDGQIPGARHIHITRLPDRMDEVPKDSAVYIFCGSGLRSMIGASLLQREGWQNMVVILGGLAGWNSASCPIKLK